jgi:chaperone required for assembly of F1-ATPase
MRDLFEQTTPLGTPDPTEAARRAMRPQLRRRFYTRAGVESAGNGFCITVDDRAIRTPARNLLAAPGRALAQALAEEWTGQGEFIDPAKMPLTRLANTIIDAVSKEVPEFALEVEKYLATDLVFYRADQPEALAQRQAAAWDSVLAWADQSLGTLCARKRADPRMTLEAIAAVNLPFRAILNDWAVSIDHHRIGTHRACGRGGCNGARSGVVGGQCGRGLEHKFWVRRLRSSTARPVLPKWKRRPGSWGVIPPLRGPGYRMARPQGGNSYLPEGGSTALRRAGANAVGWGPAIGAAIYWSSRPQVGPTQLAPIKSGSPASIGRYDRGAAPLRSYAIALGSTGLGRPE